ncbi:MAG TPA: YceI family protein [Novosphingobium sp.]|nr:YceI family protein [Novosphingobium sp.]HZV11374.1 YceI family protein [Novosphingobium sp.]
MRMIKCLALASALTIAHPAAAKTWVSDPVGTWLELHFKHSNLFEVTTSVPNMIATVDLDGEDLTKAHFEISAAVSAMWSHNTLFIGDLKSDQYFWADRYPVVTFSSDRVVKEGTGYRVEGQLTARGVTRPFAMAMVPSKIVPWDGVQFRAFTLNGVLHPKDFGMPFQNPPGLVNDPLFDNQFALTFTVEVTDKPNASAYTPLPSVPH